MTPIAPRRQPSSFTLAVLSIFILVATGCASCKHTASTPPETGQPQPVGPSFNADSAMAYCQRQCQFGPRAINTEAHELCARWIADKFASFGCEVTMQQARLTGWDANILHATNIIASHHPHIKDRILLCAHYDSRPWADNDPDTSAWHKPIMAANDAASGVAVMLEVARLLQADTTLNVGVDFVCFDAEDYGVPQWSDSNAQDSWALGAQYWATHLHKPGYTARYGVLLDMVGGQAARFYKEGLSLHYAPEVVSRMWSAAAAAGYSSYFPSEQGGYITDDHEPVNQHAHIPCIDIVPYYPDCPQSSFGPTWHTLADDMAHLDPATLKAVGQTLIQLLYTE